jgi:hypothetical protein
MLVCWVGFSPLIVCYCPGNNDEELAIYLCCPELSDLRLYDSRKYR